MFRWSTKTPSSSDDDEPSSSDEEAPPSIRSGYSRVETTKEKPQKPKIPYDERGYAPKPPSHRPEQHEQQSESRDSESKQESTKELSSLATGMNAQQANEALGLIGKAGFIVKLMAILQNPAKIGEILSAKNFKSNIKEHYGTNDPKEVSKMIFHDLQDALKNGTWSVGRLAFFGGCYGTVAAVLALLPPASIFKVFTPLAGMNIVFLLIFGVVIMTVESSGDTISATLKRSILYYCKALETIWGRGLFYCYVGTTCILAPDHNLYGYYMLTVGVVMLIIYRMTSGHMKQMATLFRDHQAIEDAYEKYGGLDAALNREEVVLLLKEELHLELSHAELEMLMDRLDPNHDGVVTIDEMKDSLGHLENSQTMSYTIHNVPKFDPRKFNFALAMEKREPNDHRQGEESAGDGGGADSSSSSWFGTSSFFGSSGKENKGKPGSKAVEIKGYNITSHT